MLVFTLLVSSRQRLSVRIDAVDCEESTYPSGLALSTAGKALIRQDWHCRLRGKHLSARIGTVDCGEDCGESTYPPGLALSPLGKALIRQDWHCPRWGRCLKSSALQRNGKSCRKRKIILTPLLCVYYYFITPPKESVSVRPNLAVFLYLCCRFLNRERRDAKTQRNYFGESKENRVNASLCELCLLKK